MCGKKIILLYTPTHRNHIGQDLMTRETTDAKQQGPIFNIFHFFQNQ